MRGHFLWGAATSGHQVDGDNRHSDWWHWEEQGNIEGGVRSGRAADHWHRYKEDLRLAHEMGLNSYRFSIEWARIEPEEGQWNQEALDWYENLVQECERLGLMPVATLHHFTLPVWLARQGGFLNRDIVDKMSRYVRKVTETFGPGIPMWCTINEPVVCVTGSYLGRFMPPAVHSPQDAASAFSSMLGCHAAAYDILHSALHRRRGPWAGQKLMVGYAHNMLSFRPDRRLHPLERLIAGRLDKLYNHAWIVATLGGPQKFSLPGVIPRAKSVPGLLGRRTTDFIGVNYYTKAYVQWRPRSKDDNQMEQVPVGVSFARRKELASNLDWAIYPSGLGRLLRTLKKYKTPIVITENGIADRSDRLRPRFLLEHLDEIAQAIESGVDVRGYFHWSLIDNFEWIKGFWPRFGLYSIDYSTLDRTPTRTAHLYRETIRSHGESDPNRDVLRQIAFQQGVETYK